MLQRALAPAAAQARAGDADHGGDRRRSARRADHDLVWTECFLLGALLSPTDPVLSSGVVTNPRVPRMIRHSLNLESGLNDGLALPAVLALSAALAPAAATSCGGGSCWRTSASAFATGLLLGFVARAPDARREQGSSGGIPGYQKALYALGIAFATYGDRGAATARQRADRGLRRRDHARDPAPRYPHATSNGSAADIVEIVKVADVPRVRLAADRCTGCSATAGQRSGSSSIDAARGAARRPCSPRSSAPPPTRPTQGLHVVVRPQGRVDDRRSRCWSSTTGSRRARGSSTSRRWSCSARSSPTA